MLPFSRGIYLSSNRNVASDLFTEESKTYCTLEMYLPVVSYKETFVKADLVCT